MAQLSASAHRDLCAALGAVGADESLAETAQKSQIFKYVN